MVDGIPLSEYILQNGNNGCQVNLDDEFQPGVQIAENQMSYVFNTRKHLHISYQELM